MKKMIIVIVEKCLGCKSCELACAVAHSSAKDLNALINSAERPGYRVHVEAYKQRAVPVHCNHCQDAPCIMVCPTGAIHRKAENEPVLFDTARCIGCKMCVQACPFGVITMRLDGKGVLKCDMCVERLAEGKEPACVVACPTNALVFGDEEQLNRAKRRKTAEQLVSSLEEE